MHALLPYGLVFLVVSLNLASPRMPNGPNQPTGYRFDRPDAQFTLDNDLEEISGLTILDDDLLGAVQDEEGRLYIVDARTGEVIDDKKFEQDGDFEDLERVGNAVFVLRSDGALYEIKDWREDDLDTDRHKTHLNGRYDTEGLAYDAANNRLLVACKEYAGKGLGMKRAIFAFDLEEEELSDEPVLLLDLKSVDESLHANAIDRFVRALAAPIWDLHDFKPSAIAVHPITGNPFVLSSVRKALVESDANGQVVRAWELPDDLFKQPESLVFLPNGDLFIANEGAGDDATLLRFDYQD